MEKPVLYDYFRSSASYRVRIALNLAGIQFETVSVNLLENEQNSAVHLARNPQGLVPVLEIDGHILTQSLAIVEYLDTTCAVGLLPQNPAKLAQVQALAYCLAVDVHPICNTSVVRHVVDITGGADDTMINWMQHFIRPGLLAFEKLLSGFGQNPYCTGESVSLADVCLIPQLYNADRWQIDYSDCPRICAAAAENRKHPAFIGAHPDQFQP